MKKPRGNYGPRKDRSVPIPVVLQIRKMRAAGKTRSEISAVTGVNPGVVQSIYERKTYKDIP